MDKIIFDLHQFLDSAHAVTDYERHLPTVITRLGFNYKRHEYSFYDPESRTVYVRYDATRREAEAEAAHELVHAIALEGHPCYDDVLRYYHSCVHDMEAHIELITDSGADRFLMPDELVREIIRQCGLTARAVWELSRFANVDIQAALRRIVEFNPSARIAGFFSCGGYIQFAQAHNLWLPVWNGDRVPEPHILIEHGITVFKVPGDTRRQIALIVPDEFEAA